MTEIQRKIRLWHPVTPVTNLCKAVAQGLAKSLHKQEMVHEFEPLSVYICTSCYRFLLQVFATAISGCGDIVAGRGNSMQQLQ